MNPIISKIGIENFKSFRAYTELAFSDVTIVSGLNSAGKSSIYQALFVLAQSYGNYIGGGNDQGGFWRIPYLALNGDLVNLGIPSELLNDSDKKNFTVKLFWDDSTKTTVSFSLVHNKEYEKKKMFMITDSKFEDSDGCYCSAEMVDGKWRILGYCSIDFINKDIMTCIIKSIHDGMKDSGHFIGSEKLTSSIEYFKEKVIFENILSIEFSGLYVDNFSLNINDLLCCINDEYINYIDIENLKNEIKINNDNSDTVSLFNGLRRNLFKYNIKSTDFTYLPPFRGFPQRVYSLSDINRLNVERFHSERNIPYYFDVDNGVVKIGSLKEAINYWIVEHFSLADEVLLEEPIPELASEVLLRFGEKKVPINNVGFGTSQIIPVIYEILSSVGTMLTFVDEPEIHLHPSAQSKLADFFFHMGLIGKKLVIETHSEYIIDKTLYLQLMSLKYTPSITMLWVKKKNNSAYVDEIIHDDLGFMVNAPEGFLSEKNELAQKISELRFSKV